MRLLLLVKWALAVLFLVVAWVLALPLLCAFTALDREGFSRLCFNFGAALRFRIESDFRGLRARQATAGRLDRLRRQRVRSLFLTGLLLGTLAGAIALHWSTLAGV